MYIYIYNIVIRENLRLLCLRFGSGASVLYPGIPSIAGQMAFSFITNAAWSDLRADSHGGLSVKNVAKHNEHWQ